MTAAEVTEKRGRVVPAWLLEGLLIVVSVLLGFAITQYGEYRDSRELARRALQSIAQEIAANRAALEPLVPIHEAWVEALANAPTAASSESAFETYMRLRPPLPENSPPYAFLRRSAWDAAVSSGALRFIDYDVASAISEITRLQEIVATNVEERLGNGALTSVSTFDPASRAASLRLLRLTMTDIAAAEGLLLELYAKHLPAIAGGT